MDESEIIQVLKKSGWNQVSCVGSSEQFDLHKVSKITCQFPECNFSLMEGKLYLMTKDYEIFERLERMFFQIKKPPKH